MESEKIRTALWGGCGWLPRAQRKYVSEQLQMLELGVKHITAALVVIKE